MNLFIQGLVPKTMPYQSINSILDSSLAPIFEPTAVSISTIFSSIINPPTMANHATDSSQKPPISSFIVHLNGQYIDPNLYSTPLFQTKNNNNDSISLETDNILTFRPKLLGGKGGFGNNLKGKPKKQRLPHDESQMRNNRGERLGVERERELLRQLEHDLKEQERGEGRNPALVKVMNHPTKNPANAPTERLLNSVTAAERINGGLIPPGTEAKFLIRTSDGDVRTATEIANSALTQKDAITRGLVAAKSDISAPKQANVATPDDCGLDLSDLSDLDEDDDEDDSA